MKNKIITSFFIVYIFIIFFINIIKTFIYLPLKRITDNKIIQNIPYKDKISQLYKFLPDTNQNLEGKIIKQDDYLLEIKYKMNYKAIDDFVKKINNIKVYFTNKNNTHIIIIPNKYYYQNKISLKLDYNYIYSKIKTTNIKEIAINQLLTIDDYYKTDSHLKQENLNKIIKEIVKYKNIPYKEIKYTKNYYPNFCGNYTKLYNCYKEKENFIYLTNNNTKNIHVNYMSIGNQPLYNYDKLKEYSYDIFVNGITTYAEIKNDTIPKKELVVFADTTANAIIPLLSEYYSKIVLINTQDTNYNIHVKGIKFTNQDVIFIYNIDTINNN